MPRRRGRLSPDCLRAMQCGGGRQKEAWAVDVVRGSCHQIVSETGRGRCVTNRPRPEGGLSNAGAPDEPNSMSIAPRGGNIAVTRAPTSCLSGTWSSPKRSGLSCQLCVDGVTQVSDRRLRLRGCGGRRESSGRLPGGGPVSSCLLVRGCNLDSLQER